MTAAHLVCSTSGKDSLLAWSQTDGLVHVSVLTEEVLPAWSYDHIPQTSHDPDGRLTRATMVAEAADVAAPDSPGAPPLLLLASADLALSADVRLRSPLSLTADPLVPERIFCRHGRGVDSITLRWLPFSDLARGERDLAKVPPPDVCPLLDVSGGDEQEARPLMGLAVVSDSAGETWLVASPVGGDCVVISVRSETPATLPALLSSGPEGEGPETPALSPELLQGPKKGLIPKVSRGAFEHCLRASYFPNRNECFSVVAIDVARPAGCQFVSMLASDAFGVFHKKTLGPTRNCVQDDLTQTRWNLALFLASNLRRHFDTIPRCMIEKRRRVTACIPRANRSLHNCVASCEQAPRGPPVAASSHEGRLVLHARAKALREVYIEYAHRAHVELTARAARLAEIAQEQRAQVEGAQRGLEKTAATADEFEGRLATALARHAEL